MFPYELREGSKIFIVTWYNGYPQLIIYEVISLNIVYDTLYEKNGGYTAITAVNLVTSVKTMIIFWNDVNLEEGESGVNLFRTTNEQLAVKKFEETLKTNSSQETPKT